MNKYTPFFMILLLSGCVQKKAKIQTYPNCYPENQIARIEILVADTNKLSRYFIPENDTIDSYPVLDGIGFVKLDGRLVHKPLRKVELNKSQLEMFLKILRTVEVPDETLSTICLPVYRHVVQMYNSEKELIGQMQICFQCNQVRFNPKAPCLDYFENVRLNELKAFFRKIGIPLFEDF